MGDFDWVLNPIKAGYNYLYGDPAKQQKDGYTQAGNSASALGNEMQDYYKQQGRQAMNFYGGNYGKAPPTPPKQAGAGTRVGSGSPGGAAGAAAHAAATGGPSSDYYGVLDALNDQRANRPEQQQQYFEYMNGQVGKLTNEEELYNARKSGNDPAAAYEDQRATENINKQLAARGRFNSGPGVRQVSDYLANANAQRSHQLAELAGGADSSRLSRDNAYGESAKGASGEESKYFNDITSGYQTANDAMASTFGHFSDEGSQAYMDGKKAQMDARLAAQGVDAATRKQMVDDVFKGIGAYEKGSGGGA